MASDTEDDRNRLPFEPGKGKKKSESKQVPFRKTQSQIDKKASGKAKGETESGIPEYVTKRMFRRMTVFGAVPSVFGILLFFVSYYFISSEILEIPNVVVLIATLVCFGLGFVGLSYGTLSASWDPEEGSLLGFQEVRINLRRLGENRARSKQKSSENEGNSTSDV